MSSGLVVNFFSGASAPNALAVDVLALVAVGIFAAASWTVSAPSALFAFFQGTPPTRCSYSTWNRKVMVYNITFCCIFQGYWLQHDRTLPHKDLIVITI